MSFAKTALWGTCLISRTALAPARSSSTTDLIYKIGVDGNGQSAWQIYYFQQAPIFGVVMVGDASVNLLPKRWRRLPSCTEDAVVLLRRDLAAISASFTGTVRNWRN